jgi:transcription antitermination factor NusG
MAESLRWYALYLRSRHEKAVDLRLREREIETYLPMIEEMRQYSDRKKNVIESLFRGEPSKIKREPYLARGEHVRVTAGPFEGIEGYVLAVKGSVRVVVSVESIGQSLSVEVGPDWVTKL